MGLAPLILTDNWGHALEPGIIAVWDEEQSSYVDDMNMLARVYNMRPTDLRTNTVFGIGASSNPTERPEGGPLPKDSREQMFKQQLVQQSIDKGIDITYEMMRFGEYMGISQLVRDESNSFTRKMLVDGWDTFNNAFDATNYPGPDSVALCSATHDLSPTNGNHWSNYGTTALSYDAVINTRKLVKKWTDSRGNLINIMLDTLVVPIELEDIAWTIVNSVNKPGTADNDGNFIRSRSLTVLASPFLSDANNWFFVDSVKARIHNLWITADPPTFGLDERSSSYLVNTYAGHAMYKLGWSDARWVYGHEVS